ncbi:hypothetical protein [Pseudoalteromonas phenolica]|uniref:hypothetical protein n=1 Tax=Pseudoalteromonas phenolica TaxID=161398 RepID=UPI00384D0242
MKQDNAHLETAPQQTVKAQWQAPEINTLDVDMTLGGTFLSVEGGDSKGGS